MCSCDKAFGELFLKHQLSFGCYLTTQDRIKVTHGFQDAICPECRGLIPIAAPKKGMHGRTSKIMRYYWREIFYETHWKFYHLTHQTRATKELKELYNKIEKDVIESIKKQHAIKPKYIYNDESQEAVIVKYKVQILYHKVLYSKNAAQKAIIIENGLNYSVEEYAKYYFEKLNYQVLFCESIPFHVLFGIFMYQLIQDPVDPKNRVTGFGDRIAFDNKLSAKDNMIWTILPSDFGSHGYYLRRKDEIDKYIEELDISEWLFNYWLDYSTDFRNYLWAHRAESIEIARKLISILSHSTIKSILLYLAHDYWNNYCGWPDLLVYNSNNYFFCEVKSSHDKLSADQKNWIRGNSEILKQPFKILKLSK